MRDEVTAMPTLQVRRKQPEADGVCSLELVDPHGGALPPFSAGSHIDVHLPDGLVRQYSLCNPPNETHRYLIAVLHTPDSRGGSRAVHERLHEGDLVRVSEPRNHFELAPAEHAVLLGGGIGITPILCMAEQLTQAGASFELHYCSRSPSRTAFRERIEQSGFADRTAFHFDDGAAGQKLDIARVLAAPGPGKRLYVCGPTGFMDWVIASARSSGWDEGHIHREYFAAAPVDHADDGAFDIRLARTGGCFTVGAGQTVIEVLTVHSHEVETSCEQGVCGTCLTRVLDGDIDHRDLFLSDAEKARNDQFTPCVSRAKAGCRLLVLDL